MNEGRLFFKLIGKGDKGRSHFVLDFPHDFKKAFGDRPGFTAWGRPVWRETKEGKDVTFGCPPEVKPKGKIDEEDGIGLGKPFFEVCPTSPAVNDPAGVGKPFRVEGVQRFGGGMFPAGEPLIAIYFKEGEVQVLAKVPREGGFSTARVADDGDFLHGSKPKFCAGLVGEDQVGVVFVHFDGEGRAGLKLRKQGEFDPPGGAGGVRFTRRGGNLQSEVHPRTFSHFFGGSVCPGGDDGRAGPEGAFRPPF